MKFLLAMIAAASMTFADIKLRVAQRAELIQQDTTSGKNVARVTQPDAQKIADAVRDGQDEFWRANDWSFATQFVQFDLSPTGESALNIAKDPRRYLLSETIESLPKTTVLFTGPSTNPGGKVRVRHMDEVAARCFMDPSAVGSPEACAGEYSSILRPGLSQRGGIEMRFYPKPDQAYTVGFRAKVAALPFIADHQRGNWPAVHDLTIVAFSVRELFRQDRSAEEPSQARAIAQADADVAQALATSIKVDNEDYRPHTLGAANELESWPTGRLVKGYDTDGSLLVSVTVYD